MKRRLTLLLICFVSLVNGQDVSKMDSKSLLIGTLSDYLGRRKDPRMLYQVDRYSVDEKRLVSYVEALFKDSTVDWDLQTAAERWELYSKAMSDWIDDYYRYEPSRSYTLERDTIYQGRIRPEAFKTEKEILSFLAGTYLRFGEANDTTCCIRIHNSLSKVKTCQKFLEDMHCQNVKFEVLNNIPASLILYFDPTPELAAYLDEIMPLRLQLAKDRYDYFTALFEEASLKNKKRMSKHQVNKRKRKNKRETRRQFNREFRMSQKAL